MSAGVFTYAEPADREALSKLWSRVFGDSTEYRSLFFTHRFVPEQTLIARVPTYPDPVAMLFLLPITFCAGERRFEGRYIYAVATHPDFRSQGLSSGLLAEAHRRLSAQGIAFSTLVPAEPSLFDYYGARGYHTEFFRQELLQTPDPDLGKDVVLTPVSLPTLLPLRDTLYQHSRLYGRWDANALDYQQRETTLMGGETLCFSIHGMEGYAVCYPVNEVVLIKEWGFAVVEQAILSAIARRYHRKNVRLDLPSAPDQPGVRPFAMTNWYQQERKREDGLPPVLSLVLD